jgi:hypothetical protein
MYIPAIRYQVSIIRGQARELQVLAGGGSEQEQAECRQETST